MEDNIKIDTQVVSDVAYKLDSYNTEINNAFEVVNNAINDLNYNWVGNASEQAMSKFYSIKEEFVDRSETSRSGVMQRYVKFLKEQIGQGYEITEEMNTKLAEAFK